MEPTLTELLTWETLRRLAGQRSFERGEAYAEFGAVGSIQWDDASIRARVQGTGSLPRAARDHRRQALRLLHVSGRPRRAVLQALRRGRPRLAVALG